ncbi:invasion associated locus B family protein [Bradyrhizobium sp. AZCC 2289]|uniref:invasion associated locus B family protein n=1 Tax=Bradyrhizobium sp. AZCC 2289 TaxID=3117026 RepID=UPI002FF3787B
MNRALVLLALISAYPVFGGSAAKADDSRAMQLTYGPWTKLCFKRADGNSDCFISAAARGACHPSGGGVSISIRDEKTLSLLANFGTKRALEGEIGVQIDQDAPILIPHPECFGLGCRGKLDIDSEFIERLKRSRTIAIEATDTAYQELSLSFSLADFAAAYDGPAGDPPKVRGEIFTSDKMKQLTKQSEQQKQAFECRE